MREKPPDAAGRDHLFRSACSEHFTGYPRSSFRTKIATIELRGGLLVNPLLAVVITGVVAFAAHILFVFVLRSKS